MGSEGNGRKMAWGQVPQGLGEGGEESRLVWEWKPLGILNLGVIGPEVFLKDPLGNQGCSEGRGHRGSGHQDPNMFMQEEMTGLN